MTLDEGEVESKSMRKEKKEGSYASSLSYGLPNPNLERKNTCDLNEIQCLINIRNWTIPKLNIKDPSIIDRGKMTKNTNGANESKPQYPYK